MWSRSTSWCSRAPSRWSRCNAGLPAGDEVTELRLSVPEAGKRLLPLPVAVWHKAVSKRVLKDIGKGDDVLVYGQLARRFYRSGAGARSLTEVVATGIKKLQTDVTE